MCSTLVSFASLDFMHGVQFHQNAGNFYTLDLVLDSLWKFWSLKNKYFKDSHLFLTHSWGSETADHLIQGPVLFSGAQKWCEAAFQSAWKQICFQSTLTPSFSPRNSVLDSPTPHWALTAIFRPFHSVKLSEMPPKPCFWICKSHWSQIKRWPPTFGCPSPARCWHSPYFVGTAVSPQTEHCTLPCF